jgi:uncharacterized Zn finger protein
MSELVHTTESTGCPACGSDDYTVSESLDDGTPDYSSEKTCEDCGEVWT